MADPEKAIRKVAEDIRGVFPHHSDALVRELNQKMTNGRWNKCLHILCSLSSLPGVYLNQDGHIARSCAAAGIVICGKMARFTFGGKGSEDAKVLAEALAGDVLNA